MYKSCSRCGKIHDSKYVCTKGKIYFGGEERKLRSTNAWTQKSLEVREKANWLCEVCRQNNRYTYDNLEVHHIVKVKDNREKLLDDYNLVVLCKEHHREAEQGKITAEYLIKLAHLREDSPISV